MAKTVDPSRRVLYFRKGGAVQDAARLALQTEHEKAPSRDRESTPTKDGAVAGSAPLEEEVTFTALIGVKNPTFQLLEDAMYKDEWIEMWEINLDDAQDDGSGTTTYGAEYRQGYLNEFSQTFPTDDNAEAEGTFQTVGVRQEGRATLSAQQVEELSYVFHDVTKNDPADDGLAAGQNQGQTTP